MKQTIYLFLLLTWLVASCNRTIDIVDFTDDEPIVYPDYRGVVVPVNIAPLCFSVDGIGTAALVVKGKSDSLWLTTDNGSFNIPQKQWKRLLADNVGGGLDLTICKKSDEGWVAMKPFRIEVSADSIDQYLVYRRLNPGYGLWNRMSLCQRCLENYDEEVIYDNKEGRGNCINCHSFCNGNPDKWQVHIRMRHGGTYLFDGNVQSLLKLKDRSHGNPVYPSWHPSGRYIAYSNNNTFFLIHTLDHNRWEVMDDGSDVFVANIETGEQYRSSLTSSDSSFETFPAFSPDGRYLYFCTAEAADNVIASFDSVRYSICRIEFDAQNHSFGNHVDTLYNADLDGGSASFPRISPDGRWLCFTRSSYGNFSICHRDADLCMIDLNAYDSADSVARYVKLDNANSSQVDSYHSWSSNSRWIVFSSKRDDAIYTKPYFAHINADGSVSKAFLLPQRDARNRYDLEMDCYNLPEMIRSRIKIDRIVLDTASTNTKTQVSVN